MIAMPPILIVARHEDGKYSEAVAYRAETQDEAKRFCDLWDARELALKQMEGGYPGEAYIVGSLASAAEWIAEEEETLAEFEEETA